MMRLLLNKLAPAIAGLMVAGMPIFASAELSAADKIEITRAETYLNELKTMQAEFLQIDAYGGVTKGDVYMRRPGRMRFEYSPPAQILVVADGTWLVFHDKELKETTRLPLFSTPVSVLLKDEIKLSGDVTVTNVENDGKTLRITLVDTDNPDEGSIMLVFADEPLKLRQWLVTDAQNNVTSISIGNIQRNLKLRPELFTFFDSDYQ
ncbi:MAG: outer membrane lipoprotein carrier protein LolA [Sneathiella sp.]